MKFVILISVIWVCSTIVAVKQKNDAAVGWAVIVTIAIGFGYALSR